MAQTKYKITRVIEQERRGSINRPNDGLPKCFFHLTVVALRLPSGRGHPIPDEEDPDDLDK